MTQPKVGYSNEQKNTSVAVNAALLVSDDGNGNLSIVGANNPLAIQISSGVIAGSKTATMYWTATQAWTGIAVGDRLKEVQVTDTTTNTVTSDTWYNMGKGGVEVAAPADTTSTWVVAAPATPATDETLESGFGDVVTAIKAQGSMVTVSDSNGDVFWVNLDESTSPPTATYYVFGSSPLAAGTPVLPVKPYEYVSGTVTANIGTPGTLALESGGNLAGINTATGAKADAEATDSTSAWSVIALLKGILSKLSGALNIRALSSSTDSVAVTGTFWPTTQPVSAAQLTDKSQETRITDGTVTLTMGQQVKAASLPVVLASDQDAIGIKSTARTATTSRPTTNGTVAAGTFSASFYALSGTVTVNGVALEVGASREFVAPLGDTLNAIPYTVSAGSVEINVVA